VKPELVARVRFTDWTDGRHLRAPRFLGLQEDRDPKECTFEEQMKTPGAKKGTAKESAKGSAKRKGARKKGAGSEPRSSDPPRAAASEDALNTDKRIQKELEEGASESIFIDVDGRRLHLTNLNKVYFPQDGFRKRDLLAHYFWAAPMILPFLKDRPLVLRRYPNGIEGESFFQKDAGKDTPDWVKTVSIVSEDRGRTVRYIIANDRAGLSGESGMHRSQPVVEPVQRSGTSGLYFLRSRSHRRHAVLDGGQVRQAVSGSSRQPQDCSVCKNVGRDGLSHFCSHRTPVHV
jgi:bifunctional non-homologous end joining protein LigD